MAKKWSPGKALQERLLDNLRIIARGLVPGGRNRPIITGVTNDGKLVDGMTMGQYQAQGQQILLDSGDVYRWGASLVYEFVSAGDRQLLPLATPARAEPGAPSLLSNLFSAGVSNDNGGMESLVPDRLVKALLANPDLWDKLPAIQHYARRPIYDPNFNLCGPGWHPEHHASSHRPSAMRRAMLPPDKIDRGEVLWCVPRRWLPPCWPRRRSHARRAARTGAGSGSPHPRPWERRIRVVEAMRAPGLPRR